MREDHSLDEEEVDALLVECLCQEAGSSDVSW